MARVGPIPDAPAHSRIVCRPDALGRLAAQALRDEAVLTPKPGLVDLRGGGAHDDMDVTMLLASADALERPIARCGQAALALPLDATSFAARLAGISDPVRPAVPSHGALACRRYGASGAVGEACMGFPHTMRVAWPALRAARAAGHGVHTARTDALVASMARLDDTCLLHRAGPAGLRIVRDGAAAILRAGGSSTPLGKRLLEQLDRVCRRDRLSPGGSGDVLAATLFMDSVGARPPAAGKE
jgi:triphosphoribosyl-dephospho-CoA synthase